MADSVPVIKKQVVIVYGGELAKDVAEQIVAKKPTDCNNDEDHSSTTTTVDVLLRSASDRPKTIPTDYTFVDGDGDDSTTKTKTVVVCFVFQTIENGAPTEDGGPCVRFFHRKTHPDDLLSSNDKSNSSGSSSGGGGGGGDGNGGGFKFAVLGLGDSNLLLDRQTTTAKDCNQVAQRLDARLEALGATRFHPLGLADERTGLQEVEPWIESFWRTVCP